jgi:hypothetical protein
MGDSVAIFHHEIATAPSPVEIDESLPLPNTEDSIFKQAEVHERVVGAAQPPKIVPPSFSASTTLGDMHGEPVPSTAPYLRRHARQ